MVDRLRLLTAVNMIAPPTTKGVAQRLSVPKEEAESALRDAERVQLVAKQQLGSMLVGCTGVGRQQWWLSENGRAELRRLLAQGNQARRGPSSA